jgi:glucokinase
MKKDAVIGIDIGGTFTKFGIIDRLGNVVIEGSVPTNQTDSVDEYIKGLITGVDEMLKEVADFVTIKGIGVGAPNANYLSGSIEFAANLKWAKGKMIPLVTLLRNHYNMPVAVTNDANAAALGEMIYGNAKGKKDFILITLGTGLGSGLVVNGELVYGHDGFAGELGHIRARDNGRVCGCGRRGCLETYVSAPGIKRTVFELLAEYTEPSELRGYSFNDLDSEMIYHAATRGDFIALKAFEATGDILGLKLADAVAHNSPEIIFLFGGLAKAGDYILNPTRESFERNLLKIYQNKIPIVLSALPEGNVAVLGASALIWNEINKN